MPFPSSPRKTRSRATRLAPSNGDVSQARTQEPHQHRLSETQLIPTIPVMKATSMEPVVGRSSAAEKRSRHKMTEVQLRRLEDLYQADTHPSREAKAALATEVGMSFKSVLIWFQNRRQDRRRKPAAVKISSASPRVSGAAAARKARPGTDVHSPPPPSRTKHTAPPAKAPAAEANTEKGAHPSSATSPSSSLDTSMDTDVSATSTVMHVSAPDSSRCSSHTLGSDDGLSSNKCKCGPDSPRSQSTHIPFGPPSSQSQPLSTTGNIPPGALRALRPNLEWACANSAARRNHGIFVYRDEDDSAGESSEHEAELSMMKTHRVRMKGSRDARPHKRRRIDSAEVSKVAVPREFHAVFAPDVILGASLLLTLKHSADTDMD